MKKFSLFILLIIAASGCRSFPVMVKDNPFENGKVVTCDMWHDVIEGDLDNMRALYERKIVNGRRMPTELTLEFQPQMFSFSASTYIGDLEPWVEIGLDNKSYKLKFVDLQTIKQGVITDGKVVETGVAYHYKGKIIISPEIERNILDSSKYFIRVSKRKSTKTVLQANQKQLAALKKFLSDNPEK